jgi:hypothetical protein
MFHQEISQTFHTRETLYQNTYEGVSKSFQTGRMERELVQLSATECNYIGIPWVSLVSFNAITLCVASERVTPKVSIYFVIDSIRILELYKVLASEYTKRSFVTQTFGAFVTTRDKFYECKSLRYEWNLSWVGWIKAETCRVLMQPNSATSFGMRLVYCISMTDIFPRYARTVSLHSAP